MSDPSKHAFVYKVCQQSAWQVAVDAGQLALSEDDQRDGFVHLSSLGQLPGTLRKHFAGQRDLVLLTIPIERLSELVWEPSRDGQLFPHLYAPLRTRAVARAEDLEVDAAGNLVLPSGLE
jgi:uncharacterized protein (DUF952 family)